MEHPGRSLELSQPLTSTPTSPDTVVASPFVFADSVPSFPGPLPPLHLSTSHKHERWQWWWTLLARLPRRTMLLLALFIAAVAFLAVSAVQYGHRQGPFMFFVEVPPVESLATHLSPPLDVQQLPFLDLCLDAEVMETHVRHRWGRPEKLRRRQLEALMDRFNHIPAHGGDSAIQWSAATGLPVSHKRWGEVKARFVTASSNLDHYVHIATTAATMAGVRFEMIGHQWRHFSFNKRMGLMLSYVKLERLSEADILVGLDSDALMAGEDMYGFLESFVASTAASEAEHLTYAVRDIRVGKRMPPLVFGTEFNCMRDQITKDPELCRAPYTELDELMSAWAAQQNVTLPAEYANEANPLRFFNAGVFVARVWALRRWNTAFLDFLGTHSPALGQTWWCDQSSMSTLYLELRRWEVLSRALDGPPQPLQQSDVEAGFYPPLVLPVPGHGPHGVPAGLVGIEGAGRLVLTVGPEMSGKGIFHLDGLPVPYNNASDVVLDRLLRVAAWQLSTSLTGVVRSAHQLRLTPREAVDCHGVTKTGMACPYRDAVLGMHTDTTLAVTPLIWHFAGAGKRRTIAHYRGLFPWYTPAMRDPVARNALVWTLINAPPTRVFAVDRRTDKASNVTSLSLLPHSTVDDLTFMRMCTYRFYEGW